MSKDETTVQIEFERVLRETDAAYHLLCPTYGEHTKEVWVPKSLVTDVDVESSTMEVMEWKAIELGLA